MANRAVKQPNGRYARFSDIVDHFTHVNLTREELFEVYRYEFGIVVANDKINSADAHPERFNKAIETIRCIYGELEADGVRAYLSCADDATTPSPMLR
jgi:hypothetical protein